MSQLFSNEHYNCHDRHAAQILDDFLPQHIFDAHVHLYRHDRPLDKECVILSHRTRTFQDYRRDMLPLLGAGRTLQCNVIAYPFAEMREEANGLRQAAQDFVARQLTENPGNVGEILVLPGDCATDLERRLTHLAIRGLKCYHVFSGEAPSWNAEICTYLPEAAWEVADRRGLCITLHLVRERALSDEKNLRYMQAMAKKYPNAVLILAHAARGFAAWTTVEAAAQLAPFENVWFDFSAICESPAIFQILKQVGVRRCLWGSDYPISLLRGKAISLADGFYWINAADLARFSGQDAALPTWLVGTENLMAVRQACQMAQLHEKDIDDLFYRNAVALFRPAVQSLRAATT